MNLKHAQYMMTILQEGSITAAAKKLFISQPSLSQMVKLVETNLGTAVFNRTTEPLSLTPAGEKYMEAAGQILAIHANLEREIEEIRAEEHGKIKFGIYACSPEDSSFKAVFTDMKLTECQWKAHDGQKPDEM